MQEKFNEQTNALNQLKDGSKDLKDKYENAEKELRQTSKEKDAAVKLVKAVSESLKSEEIKSNTMEAAVK
jgi:hypothetical protein